jgi:hypothetical protein
VSNDLGDLIKSEVDRAEATMKAARERGQAVLTASGALVTLLAGVLALARGKDAHLVLSRFLVVASITALVAFVAATVLVLLMYMPSQVEAVDDEKVAEFAEANWADQGWDQQVAIVLASYLVSLRAANKSLLNRLVGAVIAEVIGIASAAVMAVSLLVQAK